MYALIVRHHLNIFTLVINIGITISCNLTNSFIVFIIVLLFVLISIIPKRDGYCNVLLLTRI